MQGPECARCGRTFGADSRHVELERKRVPPEGREDRPTMLYLCPDCSTEFRWWLESE